MSAETDKNVRFGVLFSGAFPLMRAINGSVLADKLGYDSAWFGEDYFYWGGIATGTAVAERTENLTIGLGILTPLTRHPALTVMETAALDHISGGRLVMGYGAGRAVLDEPDEARLFQPDDGDARGGRRQPTFL